MFKINGDNWRVVFVSPYHPMLKKKDGSYTLGACVDDTKKIYINNKLSLEKVKQVLCHEITHAAMFSYDIQLTYDQEELLADLLATYGQEVIDITNKIFSKIKNNIYSNKTKCYTRRKNPKPSPIYSTHKPGTNSLVYKRIKYK